MKIAVPVSQGLLSSHFGHCEVFSLFVIDPETQTIAAAQTITPPPHEPGVLPQWLSDMGVNLVLAGGMGPQAQNLLAAKGVKSIVGCPALEPKVVVQQYLESSLSTSDNSCDHH
jgi:predicted Fe-Mo cluster-binding NifX family protein